MSWINWTSLTRRTVAGANLIGAAVGMALALMLAVPSSAQSPEPLPAPEGPVILTVTGNIAVTNTEAGAAFDRAMLEALGVTEVSTSTPWTDGVPVFTGALGRAVLERLGAEGETVSATALNDYTVEIPIGDFRDFDVLLATHINGEEMQVSDKGPIWIVYPRDDQPELQDRRLHDRWVWQLKSLDVQ